jgi:hypothetical protein
VQSAKAELPGPFDTWYGSWQEAMRTDERMRWLNDARIEVVKRSGLDQQSYAFVRRIDSYLEPETLLMRLPAGLATEAVVERSIAKIPQNFRPHVAVEVTRRWVPAGRQDDELLGVLAHCFHFLDAFLLWIAELVQGESPESPSEFVDTVLRLPCMGLDPSALPHLFEADTGREFQIAFEATPTPTPTPTRARSSCAGTAPGATQFVLSLWIARWKRLRWPATTWHAEPSRPMASPLRLCGSGRPMVDGMVGAYSPRTSATST